MSYLNGKGGDDYERLGDLPAFVHCALDKFHYLHEGWQYVAGCIEHNRKCDMVGEHIQSEI